jgi:hypothetical protein
MTVSPSSGRSLLNWAQLTELIPVSGPKIGRYGLVLSIGLNRVSFYLRTETESSLRNVGFKQKKKKDYG